MKTSCLYRAYSAYDLLGDSCNFVDSNAATNAKTVAYPKHELTM